MANVFNAGDICEITCFGNLDSQTIINTFHYQYSGPGVTSLNYTVDLQNLIANFKTGVWTPTWKTRVSTAYILNVIRAQKVGPALNDRGYYVQSTVAETGTDVDVNLPADVQMCVSISTNRSFKGATGSKRFAGLPLNEANGSVWLAGTVTAWNTVGANFSNVLTGSVGTNVYTPVVWSPNPNRRFTPGSILSTRARAEIRTQHSRTVGRGI